MTIALIVLKVKVRVRVRVSTRSVGPRSSIEESFLVSFLPREAMLSAVFVVVVCLCVCVSVTLRYCMKTAKRRITQTTPHDSPMTLVF